MKVIRNVVILFILFTTTRCASTKLSAIRNLEIQNIKLQKIMVVAPFRDIGLRQETEGSFIASLKTYQEKTKIYRRTRYDRYRPIEVDFLRSIDIIPPFKEYNHNEIGEKLSEKEIDGILVVALEDYWTSQTYIPKFSETKGEFKVYGNALHYDSYTQESGGYYISKPRVKFEIRLYDVASGEVIWMATSVTTGNAFAKYGNLVESLSMLVLEELAKEDIITKQN